MHRISLDYFLFFLGFCALVLFDPPLSFFDFLSPFASLLGVDFLPDENFEYLCYRIYIYIYIIYITPKPAKEWK